MALGIERVRDIAERVAASSGLEVVEVELLGGGKGRMLRITIDKASGVTHEDCANLSREVGTILDVEDAVSGGSYLLEVSSPGLDRPLFRVADYERFTGSLLKLKTREPVNGSQYLAGRLEGVRDGKIIMLMPETKEISSKQSKKKHRQLEPVAPVLEIDLANVEKANLVPEI
jgi:ribosome maturation factor RimP